ncbi:MAG: hypothetical protein NVSMB31_09230 [Vulcanimicrobiaceae bacterium]
MIKRYLAIPLALSLAGTMFVGAGAHEGRVLPQAINPLLLVSDNQNANDEISNDDIAEPQGIAQIGSADLAANDEVDNEINQPAENDVEDGQSNDAEDIQSNNEMNNVNVQQPIQIAPVSNGSENENDGQQSEHESDNGDD